MNALEKPPALGRVRLADTTDVPIIMSLINNCMAETFRIQHSSDVVSLIENCVLAVCQLDENKTIVGFLALKDYPLIPSVHSCTWEHYIWLKYKRTDLNARNTLFIHLLCWDADYNRELVDNMLETVFMNDFYLQYICIVKTLPTIPLLMPGKSRCEASFKRTNAMERGMPGEKLPALCIADRKEVCPALKIRRSVEEDNDDIVPILDRHSKRLKEMYGDFYISELISRHPTSARVILVCEHKDLAVGVMIVNTQINLEALEEAFELSPFAGFRHLDSTPLKTTHVENVSSESLEVQVLQPQLKKSKIAFIDEVTKPNRLSFAPKISASEQLDLLSLLEDDEEESDYEITNINPEWLYASVIQDNEDDASLTFSSVGMDNIVAHRESLAAEKKRKSIAHMSNNTAASKSEYEVRYSGAPNAFLLEVCAMHEDYDERYAFDMLESAFTLFPGRDYCLLCIPSNHVAFPLLDHFTLVTPFGTRTRFINETLYAAHINSVRGLVRVRKGEYYDLPSLSNIFEHVPRPSELIDIFRNSMEPGENDSFVLLNEELPIGVAIIGPLENNVTLRAHYDLLPEARRTGTDGCILTAVVSPVFEAHFRWYMRDLIRSSQYTSLFWSCTVNTQEEVKLVRCMASFTSHMAPCAIRRNIPNLTGKKIIDPMFKNLSRPRPMWIVERPLTVMPKVDVNNSIVVVGASRTGLAFLEKLITGYTSKYLMFTNLSLVNNHGLPVLPQANCSRICVPETGRYNDVTLNSIPFKFYVDVIPNIMTGINRKQKCLTFIDGTVKYYDELVLTCGLQYQHPYYLKEALDVAREQEKGLPCERLLMDNPSYLPSKVPYTPTFPQNVSVINSVSDANSFFKKLARLISESQETYQELSTENPIVVYGDCLEAYATVTALVEFGIDPTDILFVEDFPPDDPKAIRINCFNDDLIDSRVRQSMKNLSIKDLRKFKFDGWNFRDNTLTYIDSIYLMGPLKLISQPCFCFIYFGQQALNIHAFKAINECGLVYDGGIIVDPYFATNDPHIFAAGSCVKYSRSLYADKKLQKYYNSEDVGEALGEMFLQKLNPFVMGKKREDDDGMDIFPRYSSTLFSDSFLEEEEIINSKTRRWEPVPTYSSPILKRATLPGNLYYMKLRKPGIEIPLQVQFILPHQGHMLTTDKDGNYFRLHLNVLHCIEGITSLSKRKFSHEILKELYGKHEAFFDKLLVRYKLNEIDDFYSYFTQPWMAALYQEIFDNLIMDINHQELGTVYDLVKSRFDLVGNRPPPKMSMKSTGCFVDDIPECGFGPLNAPKLGTFKSIVDRFFYKASSYNLKNVKPVDIPSECGQSARHRHEAATFWSTVRGEAVVNAHLHKFLQVHRLSNPQYFLPDGPQSEGGLKDG